MSDKKRGVKSTPKTKKTQRPKVRQPSSVPLVRNANNLGRDRRRDRITAVIPGSDFLLSLSSGTSGLTAGAEIFSFDATPSSPSLPRLSAIARLYERFRFKRLTVKYCPTTSALTPGQIVGYFDYDAMTDLSALSDYERLRVAYAHYGEIPLNIAQQKPVSWSLKNLVKDSLFCHREFGQGDPHLYYQGIFNLIAASDIAANVNIGNIYVDYEVEFEVPQYMAAHDSWGLQITSSTGCTVGQPLGDNPIASVWSNIPYTVSEGQFTLKRGAYLLGIRVNSADGELLGETKLNVTGGDTQSQQWTHSVYKDTFEGILRITGTTGVFNIVATGLSVSSAQINMARLPDSIIGYSLPSTTVDSKEAKEEKVEKKLEVNTSLETGSMSSLASSGVSSVYSKSLIKDGYMLVKKQ